MKTTLPDKPSELLLLAMLDLEKVEADPRYTISMGLWHDADLLSGKCHVCLAGSVLAKSIEYPIGESFDMDWRTDDSIFLKLTNINEMRIGYFPFNDHPTLPDFYCDELASMSHNSDRRKEWKLHMAAMIGIMQAEGL